MASSKLTVGIAFLLAGGLCLATASVVPKRPKLMPGLRAGLTYGYFAAESVLELDTTGWLIAATVGTALVAREALKRKLVGR